VNDDSKSQNDMTKPDAQAQELTELLNLLEAVDRRITPEHVTKRFRELLDDIGDGGLTGAAADRQPREAPSQMNGEDQVTRWPQEGSAERTPDPAALNRSLETALADAQSKARVAAEELRHAKEEATTARRQAERIVAEAQTQSDLALEQAAAIIRAARGQALQIHAEAERDAGQIVSAADDKADEALQQAAKMIRDARQQSEQIISKARTEAEQIIKTARDHPVRRNSTSVNGVGAVAAAAAAGLIGRLGCPPDPAVIPSALSVAAVAGSVGLHTAVTSLAPPAPFLSLGSAGPESAIQRGRGGEPPASALPGGGQVCGLFTVDIVGFGRPDRDDDIRLHLRDRLYEMLEKAFDDSGIPWEGCYHEDRGDGALVVIPPGISARSIIDPLPERLSRLIRRHNHVSRAEAGLQLRAAAHIGPVDHDGHGFVGADVNLVFRLLDARPLKRLVAASGAELGLAVSDYVYHNLIRRYPGSVSTDALQTVRFQTKKTRTHAWVYLPGPRPVATVPAADSVAELRPGLPETDSKSIPIIERATGEDTMTGMPSQLVCDLRR